jgi:RadC-like JAB domain
MRALQQEVLRIVLLDIRFRRITAVDVKKGTVNESLAHPAEMFRRSDQAILENLFDTYRCTMYSSDARSENDSVLSISDPLTLCLARSLQNPAIVLLGRTEPSSRRLGLSRFYNAISAGVSRWCFYLFGEPTCLNGGERVAEFMGNAR